MHHTMWDTEPTLANDQNKQNTSFLAKIDS